MVNIIFAIMIILFGIVGIEDIRDREGILFSIFILTLAFLAASYIVRKIDTYPTKKKKTTASGT